MKVYAFVGPSGTGKSHHAQDVAYSRNIDYIIDDALLINKNKVIAGKSAKTEPTKIGSVKSAIFSDEARCEIMKKTLKSIKPASILILGTSDDMVDLIAKNLGLPEVSERIYINDISTPEEIAEARRMRTVEGKHVVPVPTFEIKEQFSGYFLDPLKMFEKKEKCYREKSVIRPTFSYLGNFYISDKVIKDIIFHCTRDVKGISKLLRITTDKYVDGVKINIDVNVEYGIKIPEATARLQEIIKTDVVYATGINIFSINVCVKGIDFKK